MVDIIVQGHHQMGFAR